MILYFPKKKGRKRFMVDHETDYITSKGYSIEVVKQNMKSTIHIWGIE